jgi:hypothetical protein
VTEILISIESVRQKADKAQGDDRFYDLVNTPYRSPDPGMCEVWTNGGEVNCHVALCWPHDASEHASVFSSDLNRAYQRIKTECDPVDAGGNQAWFHDDEPDKQAWYITIKNDPDYGSTSAARKRRSEPFNATELLEELSDKHEISADGGYHFQISVENKEVYDEAEAAAREDQKHSQKKRQEDDEFILTSQSFAIVKSDEKIPVGPLLSSGAEHTWENSESNSVETTITTGVSAGFWEVFTASVEVSTSQGYEVSYSESYTFTSGDCPDRGQNWLYPLFDRYRGYLASNPDETFDIWIPRGGSNIESPTLEYFIDVECLG